MKITECCVKSYKYITFFFKVWILKYIPCANCNQLFKSYNGRFKNCRICILERMEQSFSYKGNGRLSW